MNYVTHGLGGAAAGVAVLIVTGVHTQPSEALVLGGAVLGALLPDIDHRRSWMGRRMPIVAYAASTTFKHRGFTHTPVFTALVAVIMGLGIATCRDPAMTGYISWFAKGLIPGMISHLILDTLNVQGIEWLWPYKKKFHIFSIRTGSWQESLFALGMFICVALEYNVLSNT